MAVQETPLVSISLVTALKSIRFLETLKRIRFSGQLILTDPKGQQWNFYLYLGSIIYATGGVHPVRRWQRNLATHCPQIPAQYLKLQRELAESKTTALNNCWEYHLLCLWVAQQKITLEQAAKMIRAVVCEVLFDVVQAMRATPQIKQDNLLPKPLVLIDVQQAIAEVNQLWQSWWNAKVAKYSPNMAATIKQPEKLQKCTTAKVYQILTKLLNGQHPLRDLAVQMRQDVVQVTRSLLPYIELGLVELVSVPDLPIPVDVPVLKKPPISVTVSKPLVACVDDSPLVCQTMEALLVAAGYRFVGVEDALRSFAILLACKPDFIFLDLVMPHTNGYEICAKLRKLSGFRDTPIVILTGNDGIVDRVRAKLVGASDFLSKPVDAGTVLSVIRKHLEQGVISS
ncbi:MAG TPA: response regulator [Cyanobacteria bacterium UBA8553]|nr:response regulator [Cyanobacteria bacterium UBA8553]